MVASKWTAGKGRYPYNEGLHLIMVLEMYAYADESGIGKSDPICVLAGYIAPPDDWDSFNSDWAKVLADFGIDVFHAVDFFNRPTWKSSKSPFRGWTRQEGLDFLTQLLATIASRPSLNEIVGVVDAVDFRSMDEETRQLATGASMRLKWTVGPNALNDVEDIQIESKVRGISGPNDAYHACFASFIKEATDRTPEGAKVHFTFDLQEQYESFSRQRYAAIKSQAEKANADGWDRLGGLRFESRRDFAGLQAADLYAHILNFTGTGTAAWTDERRMAAESLIRDRRTAVPILNRNTWMQLWQQVGEQLLDNMKKGVEEANPHLRDP